MIGKSLRTRGAVPYGRVPPYEGCSAARGQ
jgi:hypothetical protein